MRTPRLFLSNLNYDTIPDEDLQAQADLEEDCCQEASVVVDELEDAAQVTAGAERIEAALNQSHPQNVEAANLAEIAAENLFVQLGMRKAHKPKLGIESSIYAQKSSVLKQTDRLKALAFGKKSAALEGFFDNVGYEWSQFWTSQSGLVKKKSEVSNEYDQKGPHSELLKDRPYGRILRPSGKSNISGADVLDTIKRYNRMLTSNKIVESLKEISTLTTELAKNVAGYTVTSLDEDRIRQASAQIFNLYESITSEIVPIGDKKNCDIEPLQADVKPDIMKMIDEMYSSAGIDGQLRDISQAVGLYRKVGVRKVTTWKYNETNEQWYSEVTDVIKSQRAELAVQDIESLLARLRVIVGMRFSVCFAVVRYMQESIRKD